MTRKPVRLSSADPDGSGFPAASEARRSKVTVADVDLRSNVWLHHLRGESFASIGRELDLNHETVAKIVRACYAEMGQARKETLARDLDASIERLRAIQRQA